MSRLIDADALVEKCGSWYTEEGPEEGFIGTLKSLIDEQPTIGGWISVEDRLPEEPGSYLCWFGKNMLAPGMSVASYIPKLHGFGSLEYYEVYENVTHWMPLPEEPKQIS